MKKNLLMMALPLLLAACGSQFNGTYENADHTLTMTFESADKVIVNGLGAANMEFSYQVDGKKLKLQVPDGTRVLSILDNGSIFMSPNILLKKKES